MLHDLKIALVFLTRLPIRIDAPMAPGALAGAAHLFFIAGAIAGGIGALAYLVAHILGLASLPATVVALAAMAIATGALHEDGLADTADALGVTGDRERALSVMRDSRIGSFGALALVFTVLARVLALAPMWEPMLFAAALVSAAAFSRAFMPLVMLLQDSARKDGLAAGAGRPGRGAVAMGLLGAFALGLVLLQPATALIAPLAAGAVGLVAASWLARRFGGYTGDTLGAVQQVVELAFLMALTARF